MNQPSPKVRLVAELRRVWCWTFHRADHEILEPDPSGLSVWPLDFDAKRHCYRCDKGKGLRQRPPVRVLRGGLAFGLMAALLLAGACSAPVAPHKKVASSGASAHPHACADLVVKAFTSPNAPVPGAYACLDSQQQASAADSGVYDDVDIQKMVAQEAPVFNSAVYCGRAANGSFVYAESSADGTNNGRIAVSLKGNLVDGFNGTSGTGCPSGLRQG